MQKTTIKKITSGLKIAVVVYLVCGTALYFFQEKILFHPLELADTHPFHFPGPFKEINLPVNAKKNLSIVQFTVPDSVCKGVVLYFHGNRKNIERYAPFATHFTRNNYEVWMIDYPGFGKSTGKRTEQIMFEDAATLYKMARARFSKDSIIIYGKSIGTGVAAQLASIRDCKRVILETPYYSIDALMKHYAFMYPVSWLTKYHFPTYSYVKKIEAPITLFHGTKDEVIPYKQARKLANENPGVDLVTIEKGKHNNLTESRVFHQHLDALLQLP
jgi:pimeloyl-ACP methyl ester carboxylesterase